MNQYFYFYQIIILPQLPHIHLSTECEYLWHLWMFCLLLSSPLRASPDGCLKAGTNWTAGRALNWPEWPQSGPIRDKPSRDSGSDSVVVRCERLVLTKHRTGVRALSRRGGLPGNLSCTPWANTFNAQMALFSQRYCSWGGKYTQLGALGSWVPALQLHDSQSGRIFL